MVTNQESSYEKFKTANSPKSLTGIDYVRFIYKAFDLPVDFILYFSRLWWPNFLVIDNRIFLSDLFDSERHASLLLSEQDAASAQFWMNLLEITGLFDDLEEVQALEVAENLVSCWNKKINSEHSEITDRARVILDNSTGEVFVSIGTVSP